MKESSSKANIWLKTNNFISTYKVSLLVGLTVLTALIGRIAYGVSIFHPLQEIASKQNEYNRKSEQEAFKLEMVKNHLALGDHFLDLGQNLVAKIEFEKALKLDQYCSKAEMGLFKAEIYDTIARKGYDPEILAMRIQHLMNQDTAHAHAYVYMGDVYSTIDERKAHAYYDTAINKKPSMAIAYYGKGIIFSRHGNSIAAENMYRKALNVSPWNRIFIGNLAYQYYRNRKYAKAISCCDSLSLLDRAYLVSHFTQASSYLCKGVLDSSVAHYQWLINLTKHDKIWTLEMNAGNWFFIKGKPETNSNVQAVVVDFYTIDEKKYYAYYSGALAYFLSNDKTYETYTNLAKTLNLSDRSKENINSLIIWDIENLAEVQPKYADACARFKSVIN